MTTKHILGQYFTTHNELKEKIFEFILNTPSNILEPSIGQGDLITFITNKIPSITFDMYEIDTKIKLLDKIQKDKIIYGDFMKQKITKTYKTIVGNPPYVRTKKGNLYIDFTEKCYMTNGTFTHIFHPHNEKMFDNASIDIIVFRYCKNSLIDKKVLYNDKLLYITNSNGLITFGEKENNNSVLFQDYFDIYVGLVSGKEDVYKNEELGNIELLNGEDKIDKYIYIEKYPCDNEKINNHLSHHKIIGLNGERREILLL